jgi:predicted nucleotidyltransferase
MPFYQHSTEELRSRIVSFFLDLSPRKILLFGSSCRKPINETGDVDLIIVYDTSKRFLDRLKELYERWDLPKAVDILAYTPSEFERMMRENAFVQDAVAAGVVIYDAGA